MQQAEIIREHAKALATIATLFESGPKLSQRLLRLAAECEQLADDMARTLSERRDWEQRVVPHHRVQMLG